MNIGDTKRNIAHFAITLCALIFAWSVSVGVASASSVTYALDDVTLSDGSTLTGSFTVDWDAMIPTVTDLSMTHTAGTYDSTGAYITYDPYFKRAGFPDYPWAPLSGQTSTSTHYLTHGVVATLAPYTFDDERADFLNIIPNDGIPDNIWTMSIDNIVTSGVSEWQILYLDFNPDTGELFLDGWYEDAFGTEWFLLGSRLHQHTHTPFYLPDVDTWATITGGSLTAVPVPAAVWLFASGLMGIVGFSSRKKAA